MNFETMKSIPISYSTDDVNVKFTVEFGKAKYAYNMSVFDRTDYTQPYAIEKHTKDDKQMFCLMAEEGGFAMHIFDINVTPKSQINKRKTHNGYIVYKYGITVIVDLNNAPVYEGNNEQPTNEVERDGKHWIVMNGKSLKVDQNARAKFQWSTAKALNKGVKPTAEQELMGVEERHENTGMIWITFQPVVVEEMYEEQPEELSRGLTRGLTRSITPSPSHAARVGYGARVETKCKTLNAESIPNSRYVLPIRLRIVGEVSENTRCAKDLASAMRVEELQRNTSVMADY